MSTSRLHCREAWQLFLFAEPSQQYKDEVFMLEVEIIMLKAILSRSPFGLDPVKGGHFGKVAIAYYL